MATIMLNNSSLVHYRQKRELNENVKVMKLIGQAASLLAATSAIVSSPLCFLTTSFGGLAAVSCGIYCASRLVSDIVVRREVNKIPVERPVARSSVGEVEELAEMAKQD